MKIGFTTLGCPAWDLDTIIAKARAFGFDGVDFRGILDQIDVTLLPEFGADLAETGRKLSEAGLAVSGISSSIRLCEQDALDKNLEEARRTIPVARRLGASVIRVFGNGNIDARRRKDLADVAARTMSAILELGGARELTWALETHDVWIASSDCRLLLDRIPDPEFGILWDMGHTTRVTNESPAETLEAIGDRIRYLHVKDAVYDASHPNAMGDGWRYVQPGRGQLPLAEAIRLLRDRGYDGWLVLEHEKRWHTELPEPDEVFPRFVEWARSV
ncbi:MAG: sugar phosphate isomerase/epimerase [Phycisphaerae bacterium]|nr:sugar phosphate isomerase/epimerase [Phycisphaerae bacterium]